MPDKVNSASKRKLDYSVFVACGDRGPRRPKETAKDRRRRQMRELASRLLSHVPMTEACKAIGISPRSGTRWLSLAEFSEAYVDVREASLENLARQLRTSGVAAVEALSRVIHDEQAPATAVVSAAKTVLDGLVTLSEKAEFEERLKRLEGTAAEETK